MSLDKNIFAGTEGIQLHLFEMDEHLDKLQDNLIFETRNGTHTEYAQVPFHGTTESEGLFSIVEFSIIGNQKRWLVFRVEPKKRGQSRQQVVDPVVHYTIREAIEYIESFTGKAIKFRPAL
jgi:hypothetical protein